VSDDICECGVPGGALNLNSTGYSEHGGYRDLLLQGKILTTKPGIEPGTSWLVVRSSDHQATRLVLETINIYLWKILYSHGFLFVVKVCHFFDETQYPISGFWFPYTIVPPYPRFQLSTVYRGPKKNEN
jgi:hypothetical protein